MKIIPHNKPSLGDEEIRAVVKVLKSNWLIYGKEAENLEDNIKKFINVKYAIGVNSGHSALHLALLALNVKRGDEVILPSYTVSDLLNAIYYIGAIPILVDIEKNGFNIDPAQIENKLSSRTKAMIIPHTLGFPAKIDEIKKYKIPIIENCAQALGSFYKNKPVGSFGDISIFSFYATKMIITGQGGMVATNNKEYYDLIKDLIDYNGRDNYKVRYNYPMTDISASIGNVQFKKLASFILRRKYIASKYIDVLENKNIKYWPKKQDSNANHFRFIIKFDSARKRNKIKDEFAKMGITTIIPIAPYEVLHNLLKQKKQYFPLTQDLADTSLSIPIYPSLTDKELQRIVTAMDNLL